MDKNSIILKTLRSSIKIKQYYAFESSSTIDSEQELFKVRVDGTDPEFEKDVVNVSVSGHAVDRWNERVGPYFKRKEIEELFNKLILLPQRLSKISEGMGLVDGDIIFTYERANNGIVITTFYGRRSLNPSLYQIEALRGYNQFVNERVILVLEEDVLQNQKPPAVPNGYMEFNGVTTQYSVESYKMMGKELPILIVRMSPGTTQVIDLNERIDFHINKSVLKAIFLMRYRDFVWEYLLEHHSEKVHRLINK